MLRDIKIRFQNGITYKSAVNEILSDLLTKYRFIEEEANPDFILFGPYGNDIPSKSDKYVRIGYFCENIKPDFSICEWAFGIPREEEIKNYRYKRIQWHGLNPNLLVKSLSENDIDRIVSNKLKFTNFLYSNKVPYREEFFRQLSKYRKIDAPGKSMNNMPSIDELYKGSLWERKRQFIGEYKFTIAFENYSYPGYQTEKIYDSMQMNSIPIYLGDPYIDDTFNTRSFLNSTDYLSSNYTNSIKALEKFAQQTFNDYRPSFYNSPIDKFKRKLKAVARNMKMELQFNSLDFSPLIDRIVEIDSDQNLYASYLRTPWFLNNRIPFHLSNSLRWQEIFRTK